MDKTIIAEGNADGKEDLPQKTPRDAAGGRPHGEVYAVMLSDGQVHAAADDPVLAAAL